MNRASGFLIASAMVCGLSAAAPLAALTFDVGDVDCFGEDESFCEAGAFPTIPSFDNSAGEPAGLDVFDTLGIVSLVFSVDLAGATASSTNVALRVAGIDIFVAANVGDASEGAVFSFNGSQVGTFFEPVVIGSDINQRKITTLMFSVDPGLLLDGAINTLTITPESDFGLLPFESYAVDYARLTVNTAVVTPQVPLPAPLALLVGGLGLLGMAARRGRRRRAGKA